MNEIKLLETHGPDGPGPSDEGLRVARTRLLAEISTASGATPDSGRPSALLTRLGASRLRRGQVIARLAITGVGLAAAATAVAVMPDAWRSTTRPPITADGATGARSASPDRIKLVAVTAPEFPYALPRLGKPSFTADPGGPIIAVYPAPDGSDVVLTIGTARPGRQEQGQREISVDGRPGRIVSSPGPSGAVTAVRLTWERRPGKWVTIVGHGRHASTEAVLQLARQVVDQPQRVGGFKVTVGLIPDGWELGGFKEDGSIISYRDPVRELDLSVRWTPKPDTSRSSEVEGFQTAQTVTVNEQSAQLVQAMQFWRLTATLPDGSGFTLMAPRSFTTDQVITIARSVRSNRA